MLKGSDVIGSWLVDSRGWRFRNSSGATPGRPAVVLIFIPLLPRLLMARREGEAPAPRPATAPPAADTVVSART